MPKRIAPLSARAVAVRLKAGTPGIICVSDNLYLKVENASAGSWIFRYRSRGGSRRDMGLGSTRTYSLADARAAASDLRRLVADGGDPIERRRGERSAKALESAKAMTFRQCAEAYIAAHRAGWRNDKHAAQWPSTLAAYVYPIFGAQPVQDVDVALVMKALEQNTAGADGPATPLWTAKPETASRVRGRIESILDWATARGYRQGENPARWRGHLENLLPKRSKLARVEHHAALPYVELGAFMGKLRQQDGIAARALEFAVLTAARTGEVIGARWPEINLAERLWIVPAERMKAGREHRVPLSTAAIAALEQMAEIRLGEYVFPGHRPGQPLSNMSMLMLLRRMGRTEITAHGFRSTFSDWCAEQTEFAPEVREMALAHTVSDKVEAAYRRGDLFAKRRQLAEAWGAFCASESESPLTTSPLTEDLPRGKTRPSARV